jgi:inhibitor of KinA sporulation pathway (predicted exonuclease)
MPLGDGFPFLLVVDLEATCDDQGAVPKHEMETIEIGAVVVERESLEPVDEFATFVQPVRHPVLTEFCTKLTSIRQRDVENAPLFAEAIEQLTRFIGGRRVLFSSWGQYDKNQLAHDAGHHRVELRLRHHLNLKVEFSAKAGTTKKFGLGQALEHVGLTFEGTAHRGIDDARNIVRLLPWIFGRREMQPHS